MKNVGVYQIENFLNFSKMVPFFALAQTSGPQWPFSTNHTFFWDTLYIIFKIYSFILVTYSNITGNIFSFSIQKNLIIVHRQYYHGQYYAIEQEQSIWPPPYCSMGEIIYFIFTIILLVYKDVSIVSALFRRWILLFAVLFILIPEVLIIKNYCQGQGPGNSFSI